MRSRATTLLVALILLTAAVPAVLDCCIHGGPDRGSQAAARVLPPMSPDNSVRGCVDHAAPTQTPYIETASGGGSSPASTRDGIASTPASPAEVISAAHAVQAAARAPTGTGPPLWLSTCVSRT